MFNFFKIFDLKTENNKLKNQVFELEKNIDALQDTLNTLQSKIKNGRELHKFRVHFEDGCFLDYVGTDIWTSFDADTGFIDVVIENSTNKEDGSQTVASFKKNHIKYITRIDE